MFKITSVPPDGQLAACYQGKYCGRVVSALHALPLLFLDVDGPLIPYGLEASRFTTYPVPAGILDDGSHPGLARIDPGHGPRLAALPCELVWATAWEHDANELVGPRAGLPRLPVVAWPGPSPQDDADEQLGLHWKTRTILDWAAGRPFAWVDDEITGTDRDWVLAHHEGPALLHVVDPQAGLVAADYAALRAWLAAHCGSPAAQGRPRD